MSQGHFRDIADEGFNDDLPGPESPAQRPLTESEYAARFWMVGCIVGWAGFIGVLTLWTWLQ